MGSRSFEAKAVLGLYTETPLHCGSESGSGFVDLPIQRERHSNFPVIPGSTIKGVLRDETTNEWAGLRDFYFGKGSKDQDKEEPTSPGSVSFGDGFLVAFPVRTASVPFAWVTCPIVLERTYRAMKADWPSKVPHLESGYGWGNPGGELRGDVLLEDLVVTMSDAPKNGERSLLGLLEQLLPEEKSFDYTRSIFPKRIVAVSDEDFGWLVESATEVVTRIKLDETTHTTSGKGGNMFNEELVPRDTMFVSVLRELTPRSSKEFPVGSIPRTIRLGGDETIGRGVTWVRRYSFPGEKR
jgi:CRISPR-associated protein Cmr4